MGLITEFNSNNNNKNNKNKNITNVINNDIKIKNLIQNCHY